MLPPRNGRSRSLVGSAAQVKARLEALAQQLQVQEIVVITWTWDPAAQRRSYELLAQEFGLPGRLPRAE